jgi:hypothetical protein
MVEKLTGYKVGKDTYAKATADESEEPQGQGKTKDH